MCDQSKEVAVGFPVDVCNNHCAVWLALQEAVRIGDTIRIRRHADQLGATFRAWHFQVRRVFLQEPFSILLSKYLLNVR